MLINKNEAETMTKHISCDCKCKFNSSTCNLNKKRNKKSCQHECKNYRTCICENSKYLKSIGDTSVIDCDEIITVLGIVSTIKTNTITANVTSSASINYHSIKVRNCYILHTVLLVIILLLTITMICYHYAKLKCINALTT